MRSIAPFGLRIGADLKTKLEIAAKSNGRSLNLEMVARLARSLELDAIHPATADVAPKPLSDLDAAFLTVYRALPVEKQLALLSFFKPHT